MARGVELNKMNNVNVISVLDAKLDDRTAPALKTALDELVNTDQVLIVVNLEAVLLMGMDGLQVLTSAHQAARRKRGGVRLANLNKQPSDIMRASFPTPIFEIFGSVEEAVKSFQG